MQNIEDGFYDAFNYFKKRLPTKLSQPKIAIICGSGLGGLAETIDETVCKKVEFKYEEIPGFVSSTVQGHVGKLVFGLLGKNQTPTVCMVGRYHFYEGYSLKQVTLPVRIFKLLGVEVLIVTNASAGNNPLFGPNLNEFGPRFPPMRDVYDYDLRVLAFKAGSSLNFGAGAMKEAVYCFVGGPSYETKAEARFLRTIGGDIVGMSTVPEVIVAKHSGLRVLGLSLVTNMVALRKGKSADPSSTVDEEPEEPAPKHEEVLEVSKAKARDMQDLVRTIVELI
ncbi:inosine guanosine and [Rhizophagus clarus]|uniref:Purine nucleoside phosphorylase n=1 Tax=Rhizophagus clarus TaxID=94130 RepID=A0A8H3L5V9_9GLOM|nr:inosine guanosine and [Rhizophagus clarus]